MHRLTPRDVRTASTVGNGANLVTRQRVRVNCILRLPSLPIVTTMRKSCGVAARGKHRWQTRR
jgi:hypothetical protein